MYGDIDASLVCSLSAIFRRNWDIEPSTRASLACVFSLSSVRHFLTSLAAEHGMTSGGFGKAGLIF